MESLEENNYKQFKKDILKLNEPRTHEIKGSLGVYDAYKYIRKNKWFNIGRPLTEHEFYSIIRRVNNYLAEALIDGEDITLPHKLGRIELRKYDTYTSLKGDKLVSNLPIDWDRTLKLWYEDEEAYKERTLVKVEEKEIFKVHYNRTKAEFNNKAFYQFEVNRDLKRRLKQQIKEGRIDAFKL